MNSSKTIKIGLQGKLQSRRGIILKRKEKAANGKGEKEGIINRPDAASCATPSEAHITKIQPGPFATYVMVVSIML